jgi:hypothetical protein
LQDSPAVFHTIGIVEGNFLMKMIKTQLAVVAGVAAMSLSVESFSHGYVSQPGSRSYLCKLGENTNCGAVQYEPQSVEGVDGSPRFPIGGPADGTIAAAGSPAWSELNAQTPAPGQRTISLLELTFLPGSSLQTMLLVIGDTSLLPLTGTNHNPCRALRLN